MKSLVLIYCMAFYNEANNLNALTINRESKSLGVRLFDYTDVRNDKFL